MHSDAALLAEIAAGNETAFKMLFEKHKDKLYNYLLAIVKSKEIAEEIVLDVFLKIWTGRELITGIQNMDAFLHKVACNKALDFLRIASRNASLQKLVQREMESVKVKEADYNMLEQEYREIIDQAIQQLSPQRRTVFTLSRMHGLTYDEIARQLHLSRNTVRNTMAETLHALRSFLQKNNVNSLLLFALLFNR